MIRLIRNSAFIKLLWGLMALHLLNISVDPADPAPEYFAEDLSFNDQESIVEIIVEQILGYEDAIKEYDDHDTEDHTSKVSNKINLLRYCHAYIISKPFTVQSCQPNFTDYIMHLSDGFHKLETPPPED